MFYHRRCRSGFRKPKAGYQTAGCKVMPIKTICLLFFTLVAYPAHAKNESVYRDKWCREHNGKIEVTLPDRTRCDCLTDTHATEFDRGKKWAEAIGQALYYSLQTGKRAGVVLIIESKKDRKYWIRLNSTIQHFDLPIDTWKMEE